MAKDGTGKGEKSRPAARSARRRRMWTTGLGIAVVAAVAGSCLSLNGYLLLFRIPFLH